MKKFTAIICTIAITVTLGGCSANDTESINIFPQNSTTQSENNSSISENTETSQSSEETPAESTPNVPQGEPSFLIGLDGKAIYTSEITRLDKTDKTAETLTPEDDYALAYCDGFTYLKEPTGIAFNSYKNPELFDGWY